MLLGVPREIKNHEYRVGMTPGSVREAMHHGHQVVVEAGAGRAIGLEDDAYRQAGATIVAEAAEVYRRADMVVKVKEPQASEFGLLRRDQILFTYLHLAPDRKQTRALIDSGCIAVAYETVTDARGGLPLLAPMSIVAGRMSVQVGASCLEIARGGRGQLLGGVPGVPPAKVVVLGGGTVGTNALRMALGLEADVAVLDKSLSRLYDLDLQFGPALKTVFATLEAVEEHVVAADLVICGVLVPGAAAPKLITADMVRHMKRGAVIVDVSIDQGGCSETSRPTTHADPTYVVDGVVHYCVTNMPGAVARTSTFALNNATLPFVLALAGKGWQRAMKDDPHLANGLNVAQGRLVNAAVADALGLDHLLLSRVLQA
ncbi:MAG: alanine dehydrogenase [Alphaproteobacteria bacterium]|nr:alanine dehydrogenase [Alphaproteobacteria bacterium]